jgi:peroxiredoxin
MKKTFILFFFILLLKESSSQQGIGDCIRNSFMHMDSITKLGKNPFEVWKGCVIGKQMPDFNATSISGNTIQMNKLKGKIVFINFWFIDCHPCIAEMPALNKLVDEYKNKDVVFFAITWETEKRIQDDFLSKYKLDFIIVPDAQMLIGKLTGNGGYPMTYVVDQQGIIKEAWNGGRTDSLAVKEFYEKAKPLIDDLLKAQ